MQEALLVAKQSSDPNTQVGSVFVKEDRIITSGYNTLPKGLKFEDYPMAVRVGEFLEVKYTYVIHAEAKAIVDARESLEGSTLYVTLFPCNECAKLIIEAGVKEIYYYEDKYADSKEIIASKRMLDDAGILYQELKED